MCSQCVYLQHICSKLHLWWWFMFICVEIVCSFFCSIFLSNMPNEFLEYSNFSAVQFSHAVVYYSLQPHGLQHARLPCSSRTPKACSNSCPPSQWCHPTISSSVVPFSSCFQSFPAPGSFPMNQFFTSGGQSIGVSASASVLPTNIQAWFLLGLTDLISCSPRDSSNTKSLLQHHSSKESILRHSAFFIVQLSHPYMTTGKTIAFRPLFAK